MLKHFSSRSRYFFATFTALVSISTMGCNADSQVQGSTSPGTAPLTAAGNTPPSTPSTPSINLSGGVPYLLPKLSGVSVLGDLSTSASGTPGYITLCEGSASAGCASLISAYTTTLTQLTLTTTFGSIPITYPTLSGGSPAFGSAFPSVAVTTAKAVANPGGGGFPVSFSAWVVVSDGFTVLNYYVTNTAAGDYTFNTAGPITNLSTGPVSNTTITTAKVLDFVVLNSAVCVNVSTGAYNSSTACL